MTPGAVRRQRGEWISLCGGGGEAEGRRLRDLPEGRKVGKRRRRRGSLRESVWCVCVRVSTMCSLYCKVCVCHVLCVVASLCEGKNCRPGVLCVRVYVCVCSWFFHPAQWVGEWAESLTQSLGFGLAGVWLKWG